MQKDFFCGMGPCTTSSDVLWNAGAFQHRNAGARHRAFCTLRIPSCGAKQDCPSHKNELVLSRDSGQANRRRLTAT